MIIQNYTISIDERIEKEWIIWVKEVLIPEINSTELCSARLFSFDQKFDEGGISYALQVEFSSEESLNTFRKEREQSIFGLQAKKFSMQYAMFVTILKVV